MVNAEKHKQKEYLSEMELQDMELKLIDTINKHPSNFIEFLDNNYKELETIYNKLNVKASGNCLTSDTCQIVLNLVYMSDFTLEMINFYSYASFKVDIEIINTIKSKCTDNIELFNKIRDRQNKNLDNKTWGGLASMRFTEAGRNPKPFYFTQEYEDLIRLKQTYKKPNY